MDSRHIPMSKLGVISPSDLEKVLSAIILAFQKAYEKYQVGLAVAKASGGPFPPPPRILVGLGGRPGSGKTTVLGVIEQELEASLKRLYHASSNGSVKPNGKSQALPFPPECVCMPMDGYHLYRKELQAMPFPQRAFERRGAEWTFSPQKLYRDLTAMREVDPTTKWSTQPVYRTVKVPSFDHGVGDPQEDDIVISPTASVVLVEGNYLLFTGKPEWKKVVEQWDLKIFLQCPRAVCTERICLRHMKAWNIPREKAMARAKGSDTKNGDLVDTTSKNADVIVHSVSIPSKL